MRKSCQNSLSIFLLTILVIAIRIKHHLLWGEKISMHENTQHILTLLKDFKGIESLKKLFCIELNYNRNNTPIRSLPEGSASLVAEDPISIATAGKNNDFHVIYTKLNSETLRKTHERQIISHLQTHYSDALYVFSNTDQDNWHFVNVKPTREDQEAGEEQTQTRTKQRNIFRRITVAPEERLRTAAERIALLDIEEIGEPDGLFDVQDMLTPIDIRKGHQEAFNVEAVTEAFFESYKSIFKKLQTELKTQNNDEKWAHDFSQQFLTRCIFLYFVQRKGWLGENPDFLHTFWQTYQSASERTDTFVDKWLNILFFEAFNNRFHGGRTQFPTDIRNTLQLAPYLNGGLFRENSLDTEYPYKISDKLWEQIFTFLEQYNFTIAEDTPLDQEVGVDPEMIGKVYESLVSVEDEERGDAGIFYTPRVEIDLMCRLALVDNFANHIGTEEDKHRFYEVLFSFEPDEKEEADEKLTHLWKEIYNHLTEITVVDPACGSGSFLVGMLHVLEDLHERAEAKIGTKYNSSYERRKAIIGKNLYGVDVKEWACKVAELRLWLALIIDAEFSPAELKVRNEPLLPDFSFNIRYGDSIVQDIGGMNLAQTRAIGSGVTKDLKRKITELQNEKLKFYNNDKDKKYSEIEEVHTAENNLFRELLENYETQISESIQKTEFILENPAEQLPLLDMDPPEPQQLTFEMVRLQQELKQHQENLAQVQKARNALSSNTEPPFVWDIAFVEIFSERKGFDIVIENPPYIRQEDISDLMLPRDVAKTPTNKKAYKAKLARSVYQAHPKFFGYQHKKDLTLDKPEKTVKKKLSGRSDLYIYFYFHGLSLLNSKGTFCTITSNSWLDVDFGTKLQEFLLKKCHLKLVIDNSVKRSFKGVNINTVIALVSAPNKTEEATDNTTRFINFTVPFEAILHAVIFYEIETVSVRVSTPEHRIHPLSQTFLLTNAIDKTVKYTGDKWGGKYLRAPDIYWPILEKGQGKLIPVGNVAKIRRGVTTGANKFFVLDNATVLQKSIESDFLGPVIAYSKDVKSLLIYPEQLSTQLFMCRQKKNALGGTSALTYINWGESQGFHKKHTCQIRHPWYALRENTSPSLIFPQLVGSTAKTIFAPNGCWTLDNFTEIHVPSDSAVPLCLSLNSTLFQLMLNLSGCTNRGYGFLKVQVSDLGDLLCVDPNLIIGWDGDLDDSFLSSEDWDVLEPSEARKYIDNIIFDILQLTQGERDGVYEAVHNLVTTRLEKAKT